MMIKMSKGDTMACSDTGEEKVTAEFWDDFALDFSALCSGLRIAVMNLPPSAPSDRDNRDAHNLLGILLTGFETLESRLNCAFCPEGRASLS